LIRAAAIFDSKEFGVARRTASAMTTATTVTIHTSYGDVAGTGGDVRAYRGIPFAAPPVGPLRWRPPQPVVPWTGVRDGSAFGDDPMQIVEPRRASRAPGVSEDCLTLNVWAPAAVPAGGAPVLVWFDGGGFTAGTGARASTDGARFARNGVVVVTVNYRVGVFGYLAHPLLTAESPHHSSGNYGLLDQLAALRWVREEIAAFGGDPARVTAFGESAGGASVALLLTAPPARGLVDRVILESPGSFRPLCPLADAERAGAVIGDDLATMRAIPAADLLALNAKINPAVRGLTIPRPLRPIIDGWVIDRDEPEAFASGAFTPLPAIVGSNANEGGFFAGGIPVTTVEQLRAYLAANFPGAGDAVWSLYGTERDDEVPQKVADVFGDAQFSYGARALARAIAARQPHTYRYVFLHAGAQTQPQPVHADEIPYVFGNGEFGAPDREISDAMMAAWINFAATGDPNGPGAPAWAPYDPARDNALALRAGFAEVTGWRAHSLSFFERYFAERARGGI
jgi:para-nitrobenzyl esterase